MKRKQIRKWLNSKANLTAYISYDSEEGTLKIADCARIVSLEFHVWKNDSNNEVDRIENKIDILYDTIKEIRKDVKKRTRAVRRRNELDSVEPSS